jgi:hypothetical protein
MPSTDEENGAPSLAGHSKSGSPLGHLRALPVVRGLVADRHACRLFCEKPPDGSEPIFVAVVILFGSGIAALLVLLKYVPARIQLIRRSLHNVLTGVRRISRELVVFVVGDEPAAALSAVYFGQWLMRRMSLVLIAAVFALPFLARVVPGVISETRADQIGPWIIGIIFAFGFASLMIAGSGYGFVHGLVALDSPVTVTPAPIGHADVITVGWTPKQRRGFVARRRRKRPRVS